MSAGEPLLRVVRGNPTVEEIAASAYITGACLPVDGGATAQLGLGRPR